MKRNPYEKITAEAVDKAGGPAEVHRAFKKEGITISVQGVSKWKRVPADKVLMIEAWSGISRHQLRPDVFGPDEAAA